MTRSILMALTLGVAASCGWAQEPSSPDRSAVAKARLADLEQQINAEVGKFREEQAELVRKSQETGEPLKALRMAPDLSAFVEKYQAAAQEFAGTDDAIPFLMGVIRTAGATNPQALTATLKTLTEHHAAGAAIGPIVGLLPVLERRAPAEGAALRAAIVSQNKDPNVQANLTLQVHREALEHADSGTEAYTTARTAIAEAAAKATDEKVKVRLLGAIAEREQLAEGAIAPDIEGIDLDGVAFKLSDYKGKVIFLDFWGDW